MFLIQFLNYFLIFDTREVPHIVNKNSYANINLKAWETFAVAIFSMMLC